MDETTKTVLGVASAIVLAAPEALAAAKARGNKLRGDRWVKTSA
jgi:hypothetical protein